MEELETSGIEQRVEQDVKQQEEHELIEAERELLQWSVPYQRHAQECNARVRWSGPLKKAPPNKKITLSPSIDRGPPNNDDPPE